MAVVRISDVMGKAISTSVLSKGVGAVYQVLSLPLIMSLLSEKQFGYFGVIVSLLGWVTLLQGGIGPSVTRLYVREAAMPVKRRLESATLGVVFIYGIAILTVELLLLTFGIIPADLGSEILVTTILILLTLLFSIADSVRLGLHQQHINNLLMALSHIGVLGGLYVLTASEQVSSYSLLLVLIVIYTPPLVFKVINSYAIFHDHNKWPRLISYGKNRWIYKIVAGMIGSVILIQVSSALMKTVSSVYWLNIDVTEAGRLEVLYRLLTILGTFYPMIQIPLWPLLANARRMNEQDSLTKARLYLYVGFFIYSLVLFGVIVGFGQEIIGFWLGKDSYFSIDELLAIGLYFLGISIGQAAIILMMGREDFITISKALFGEVLLYTLLVIGIFSLGYSMNLSEMILILFVLRVAVSIFLIRKESKSNV